MGHQMMPANVMSEGEVQDRPVAQGNELGKMRGAVSARRFGGHGGTGGRSKCARGTCAEGPGKAGGQRLRFFSPIVFPWLDAQASYPVLLCPADK